MKRHFICGLMDMADETRKKVVRQNSLDGKYFAHHFFFHLLFSCVSIATVLNPSQPAISNSEEMEMVRNGNASAAETDFPSKALYPKTLHTRIYLDICSIK